MGRGLTGCILGLAYPTALVVKGVVALPGLQQVADTAFVLSSATSSFGLIALFSRFGAPRSALFGSLAAKAYGIYLVHYVFIIWLQFCCSASGHLRLSKQRLFSPARWG